MPAARTNILRGGLAARIVCEHKAAIGAARRSLVHARRAGELLLRAKEQLPYGEWLPWLAANCGEVSERSAQGYMRVARRWAELEAAAEDPKRVADLPLRAALAELAAPATVVEDADAFSTTDVDEWDAWHVNARAELAVLARAIPQSQSIAESMAIVARLQAIEAEGSDRRITALRNVGRILIEARAKYGDEFAELLRCRPDELIRIAEERIAELTRTARQETTLAHVRREQKADEV